MGHALREPAHAIRRAAPQSLLVVGGGGALGSQVLEVLLARRRYAHVKVTVIRPFTTAMRGLETVVVPDAAALDDATTPLADCALVVFDRARHVNGREAAFLRPDPASLPALARWLQRGGVRQLTVLMPHTPAGLPDALKQGLANLDEQAVAALGFEHLVFVRTAQAPHDARARLWLQRLADGVLAQLRFMVAASQQPLRAVMVARFAVEIAAQLPQSTPGTRVAPPELVWQAAQAGDAAALVSAWLAGRALPPLHLPRQRL